MGKVFTRIKELILTLYHVIAFLSVVTIATSLAILSFKYIKPSRDQENFNTVRIVIQNEIDSKEADRIIREIDEAEQDKASYILFEIDSTGGDLVASEEIANRVSKIKVPTFSYVREFGTSGAYLIAVTTDRIFATRFSNLLNIGVNASRINQVEKNKKEGLEYIELTSSKHKIMNNINHRLTPEEKAIVMERIQFEHTELIKHIATHRRLPIPHVTAFSDGTSMLGIRALQHGFVDQIGGYQEVVHYIHSKYGTVVKVKD